MFTISEHARSILHQVRDRPGFSLLANSRSPQQIEAVYSASLCLFAMIAFVFYGYRIYSKVRPFVPTSYVYKILAEQQSFAISVTAGNIPKGLPL